MSLFNKNMKMIITGAILAIALVSLFLLYPSSPDGNFLATVQDQKAQNLLETFLKNEKIKYLNNKGEFYLSEKHNSDDVFLKIIENNILNNQSLVILKNEQGQSRGEFLGDYLQRVEKILIKNNPHLKYQLSLKVLGENFGEKIYGIDILVKDVLKRDNLDSIKTIISSTVAPISSLKLNILDDEGKSIYKKSFGVNQEHGQLKQQIEKVIFKLLEPIIEDEKVYILSDLENDRKVANIAILIENNKFLSAKEKTILSEAISKKITNLIKIEARVDIKEISSLGVNDDSLMSAQDKFLYLLFATTLGIFFYLLVSIYLKNKRSYLLNLKSISIKKEQENRIERLKFERIEICENIEALIIHRTDQSVATIEKILKNAKEITTRGEVYSSGEICAVVIKELEQEARALIFDKLGTFLAERLLSFAAHENVKDIELESKVEVLREFYNELESMNAVNDYQSGEQAGEVSEQWELNHYVELIKNAAVQKDYKQLISLLDNENPMFTALIFVSLNERLQSELWKILDFQQKEKISLSLVHSKNVSAKALEFAYDCFKQVS